MPPKLERMPPGYLENILNKMFPRGIVDELLAEILGVSTRQAGRYRKEGIPVKFVPKIQKAAEQQAKAIRSIVK